MAQLPPWAQSTALCGHDPQKPLRNPCSKGSGPSQPGKWTPQRPHIGSTESGRPSRHALTCPGKNHRPCLETGAGATGREGWCSWDSCRAGELLAGNLSWGPWQGWVPSSSICSLGLLRALHIAGLIIEKSNGFWAIRGFGRGGAGKRGCWC